ncbi:transglycosylase SLT domain-containing protein [Aquibacillus halophilus]|uniref:Transglycosylase SLT domain-containing protein n=2 Tax=Aquibacillus halophilus TaxID=930132 RepID=A0A6A8DL93_9BACI|nr:transglycosylase SLT domain-containing protein [Aquibacillus halophilus]
MTLVSFLAHGQLTIPTNKQETPELSQKVKDYSPIVEKHLSEAGKEEYTSVVLALMMQESGGRGNDPMQASESYCGEIGCIDKPALSIKQGVAYFIKVLEKTNGDVKLALQSYNFGEGFIPYVKERGGQYTEELAIDFSAKMYEELKHKNIYSCIREESAQHNACYGDILYVEAVLAYYPNAVTYVDGDSVQVTLDN